MSRAKSFPRNFTGQRGCRSLRYESLEMRRVLAASLGWDGPGEGSAELSYFVGTAPSGVSQADFTTAIQTALDAWSQVADIRFVQTHQAGQSDSLDFTSTSLDGAGRTLAQAYFPDDVNSARVAGDIQFDRAEQWEIGNSLGSRAFDLVLVAAHEIGHALGLDHTSATDSVMQDSVSPNQQFVGLGVSDVAAIQSLYATAATTLATNTDTQSTTNTDFGWYWQNGGPLSRASFFPGMSANVPAHHHLYHGTDVNQDSQTSSMDALLIINLLNRGSANSGAAYDLYVDVNGDSFVTSLDALAVINLLNRLSSTTPLNAGQGEASNTTPLDDTSVESESILDTAENSTDDAKDDATKVECHLPVIGNDSIAQNPLVRLDSVSLFAHYDANGDGTLSEAEVPARTWQRLLEAEVDTNTDLSFSVEEVDAAVLAARTALYEQLNISDSTTFEEFVATLEERLIWNESRARRGHFHHSHRVPPTSNADAIDQVFANIGQSMELSAATNFRTSLPMLSGRSGRLFRT